MRHVGTLQIETQHLTLRRVSVEDTGAIYRNWAQYADSYRYLRLEPLPDAKAARAYIERVARGYKNPEQYQWVIVEKQSGDPIGLCSLSVVSEHDETGTYAVSIGKPFWNRGYASEILSALVRFGFDEIGFNRIEAYHAVDNPASGVVMTKCGFLYEGRARQKYRSNEGFEDCDMYAVLKCDNIKSAGKDGASATDGPDPLLGKAIHLAVETGSVSTSMLQRQLKLGYARASRILDEMERGGVVAPAEGSKPRAVNITPQKWLEMQSGAGEE